MNFRESAERFPLKTLKFFLSGVARPPPNLGGILAGGRCYGNEKLGRPGGLGYKGERTDWLSGRPSCRDRTQPVKK